MLYTQDDRANAAAQLKKRRLIVFIPGIAVLLLAVASFVWYRLNRDTGGWVVTALITVVGGAYMLFFGGVYLRPIRLYKRHVDLMLDGRTHETVGILKAVDGQLQDKDGIDCYAFTLNTGTGNDPNDDRLFYIDAFKGLPEATQGEHIKVVSNDRMVVSLERTPKET